MSPGHDDCTHPGKCRGFQFGSVCGVSWFFATVRAVFICVGGMAVRIFWLVAVEASKGRSDFRLRFRPGGPLCTPRQAATPESDSLAGGNAPDEVSILFEDD